MIFSCTVGDGVMTKSLLSRRGSGMSLGCRGKLFLLMFISLLNRPISVAAISVSVIPLSTPSVTNRHKLIYLTVSLFTHSFYTAISGQQSFTDT